MSARECIDSASIALQTAKNAVNSSFADKGGARWQRRVRSGLPAAGSRIRRELCEENEYIGRNGCMIMSIVSLALCRRPRQFCGAAAELLRLYQHSQYATLLRRPLSLSLKEGAEVRLHSHQLWLTTPWLSCTLSAHNVKAQSARLGCA